MSELVLKKIDECKFLLGGIKLIQGRSLVKFNIFLSGYKDKIIARNESSITFSFVGDDDFYVAKSLKSVICALDSLGVQVDVADDVENLICALDKHQSDVSLTRQKLANIKVSDIEHDSDFVSFCDFCDKHLIIKLRPYQYKSAYLLATGKGGFDFSVPGAGKTIITYAAYAYLKDKGFIDRLFVIGPLNSYNAWFDEYITCFGESPIFENLAAEAVTDCSIYLKASKTNHSAITFINGDKIRYLAKEIIQFISSDRVLLIIDEAHKIKNPNAAITKAILEITPYAKGRILLTGTPLPNGYEDLCTLMQAFAPFDKILPYNYSQLKSFTKSEASSRQVQEIRQSIAPYYSRISKKFLIQTKELLPAIDHIILADMDANQRLLYDKLNEFCGKLSDDVDEDFLMALKKAILIRKMQISANPALLKKGLARCMDELRVEYIETYENDDSEMETLLRADNRLQQELSSSSFVNIVNRYVSGELISAKNLCAAKITSDLVSQGKKVLLWEIFVDNMGVLASLVENAIKSRVEIINGAVSGQERQDAIARFRNGNSMVMIANPATLAESISLHKVCQNAIYVNRNFNAAQFMQSKDRIHRINMPKGTTATYYFIMNEETVDEVVSGRLALKERRMLAILDNDELAIGGAEFEDGTTMSFEDVNVTYNK